MTSRSTPLDGTGPVRIMRAGPRTPSSTAEQRTFNPSVPGSNPGASTSRAGIEVQMARPDAARSPGFEALADEHHLVAHSAAAGVVLAIAACIAVRGLRQVLLPVGHDVAQPFDLRAMVTMAGGEHMPIGRVDALPDGSLVPGTAAAVLLRGADPLLAPPASPGTLLEACRLGLPSVVLAPPERAADRWLDAGATLVVTGGSAGGALWGDPDLVERARTSPLAAALAPP